ncbi:hypothetical protein [Crenobacter cavernae]|uniref:hypothetical protein n=1 Tax=Crenobacter cavernae TaxID=2290923 RepID=UPI0011C01ABD|nr:hypothetical protein [Crenobacter cavernae]
MSSKLTASTLLAAALVTMPLAASANPKRCVSPKGKSLFTDEACPPGYTAKALNPDSSLTIINGRADRERDAAYARNNPPVVAYTPPVVYATPGVPCWKLFEDKRATHWRLMNSRAKQNDLTRLRNLEWQISHRACKDQ